jgi:hypothetical protein
MDRQAQADAMIAKRATSRILLVAHRGDAPGIVRDTLRGIGPVQIEAVHEGLAPPAIRRLIHDRPATPSITAPSRRSSTARPEADPAGELARDIA